MAKENDKKIIELKNQIGAKRDKLEKTKKFTPVTNCSLELDGQRYNVNVLAKDQLMLVMVKLNSYLMSAKDLGVAPYFTISGYTLTDWLSDVNSRFDILSVKDEERKLKEMEDKLDKLLSDDKKTELELKNIEDMLK